MLAQHKTNKSNETKAYESHQNDTDGSVGGGQYADAESGDSRG
jgi:hypothetical protein